jgi:anti-anti-sigma regulatory factor
MEFASSVPDTVLNFYRFNELDEMRKGTGAMEINIQKQSGDITIQLKGNLNGSTACQVEQALDFIQDSGFSRLEIDFAQVRKIEFFGVALLANALKRQRSHLTFTGLKPSAQKLFIRLGLIASPPPQPTSMNARKMREYPSWQTS